MTDTTITGLPAGTTPNGAEVFPADQAGSTVKLTLTQVEALVLDGNTLPPVSSVLGYLGLPQNSQSGNYTLALIDQGKLVYCNNIGAQTITIPANASIAFPSNPSSTITIVNMGTTNVSIAITSDTLYWSPSGSTGTRTLAPFGIVTLVKMTATTWMISGQGLT